jgi:hypothetical protein
MYYNTVNNVRTASKLCHVLTTQSKYAMLTIRINQQGRIIQLSLTFTFPNSFKSFMDQLHRETADEYMRHCQASPCESESFRSGTVEFSILL